MNIETQIMAIERAIRDRDERLANGQKPGGLRGTLRDQLRRAVEMGYGDGYRDGCMDTYHDHAPEESNA